MNKYFFGLIVLALYSSSCNKQLTPDMQRISASVSNDVWTPKLIDYEVSPSVTDPAMIETNPKHYTSMYEATDTMGTLVVFLPGTYRSPIEYKGIINKAALMGYNVIGLAYPNQVGGNPKCSATGDITCHSRLRMEIVDGVDRHPAVSVNTTNSILNRLKKVLEHMVIKYPKNGWGRYYQNGKFNWNRIILAGHSQGASIAGVMGKTFPAKRILMWSGMDYLDNGQIPDWVNNKNNSAAYYSLLHPKDELIPYNGAKLGWTALGMYQYGQEKNIRVDPYPYGNSHILGVYYEPSIVTGADKYHNFTAIDAYALKDAAGNNVLLKAWEYMFRK